MATTRTTDIRQIREHMPVVCSNGQQFATVDRVEGDYVKLTKDDRGQHHWFPMAWVDRVDTHVHVDRPGDQAMREWLSSPPAGRGGMPTAEEVPTTQGMTSGMQGMEGHEGGPSHG